MGSLIMDISKKILSIVIISHNYGKFLPATLESVKQSLGTYINNVEIILISDNSEDNSTEVCENFVSQYENACLFDVSFGNIGKVRNFAISQCSAQYITMIDGDDRILPDAFSEIIDALITLQPDILLTKLNEVFNDDFSHLCWHGLNLKPLTREKAIKKFLIHKDIQAHFIGQFIRKDLLAENPFPEYICYEDAFLFPEILAKSNTIFFSKHGPYLYFKRHNSLSSVLNEEKISLLINATDKMEEIFGTGYANLIACHWLNIVIKFDKFIKNEAVRIRIYNKIKKVSLVSFLFDPIIRFSFKKKLFQARRKISQGIH